MENADNNELSNEDFSDQGDDEGLTNNINSATNANPKHAKLNKFYQEQFVSEKDYVAKRLEVLREMQKKKFNKFPVTSGLSGFVYSSGKLYICNDAEQENNFVDEIDNQT